jgi:lysophospholipase L1-like esterase
LLTVALGVAVALGAVEFGTRLLGSSHPFEAAYRDYVSDPHLPYKPRPGSRTTGRTDEFAYDYQHNSLGFRDVERPPTKAPGTFRILGLGDSFTYGAGVALEETYLSRLEVRLNARGGRLRTEIVKAGIPRFFPEPQRLLLEHYGIQFEPDLVLVGFLPNDVIDTFLGLEAVTVDASGYLLTREARELGAWGMKAFEYSFAARLLLKQYVVWRAARKYRPRWDDIFESRGFHESDWVKIEAEFGKMASIAESAGARLVILHIPQQGPWTDRNHYPARRLSAWAARRGVEFVDALLAMEKRGGEPLYYPKDGHCTAAGHAVIADVLYRHLTARHLVP